MTNLIYNERGSGKTKQLLVLAAQENAIVLTQNAEALRVKAQAYGFTHIDIYDVRSFDIEPDVLKDRKILFHNLDRMLEDFCSCYDCEFAGGTMTNGN